jgi:hypothetical protein
MPDHSTTDVIYALLSMQPFSNEIPTELPFLHGEAHFQISTHTQLLVQCMVMSLNYTIIILFFQKIIGMIKRRFQCREKSLSVVSYLYNEIWIIHIPRVESKILNFLRYRDRLVPTNSLLLTLHTLWNIKHCLLWRSSASMIEIILLLMESLIYWSFPN